MSKESYRAGFCKKAAAHNIDPQKLAQFVEQQLDKQAAAGDVWGKVMQVIETAKQNAVNAWNRIDPELRPLAGGAIGAGVGAGGGAILGKLLGVGAGKGAIAGLGIGGISGSALGAKSWNDFTTNAHKKAYTELAAALRELEAQKKQIQNQAVRNFAEQFMEKWKATKVAPEAKK